MWLNSKGVKRLKAIIASQWGIAPKLDYHFLKKPDGRVFIASRDVTLIDPAGLHLNSLGLYFGRLVPGGLRLSIEGSQLIGPVATKNVIELDEKEFKQWLQGMDLLPKGTHNQYVIIKYGQDYFGCGRCTDRKLINLVPKERRIVTLT